MTVRCFWLGALSDVRSAIVLTTLLVCPSAAIAQSNVPIQREIIPGSELMTHQERERYRERIRSAPTAEEQTQVREQHLKQMRERARVRGLALPEPTPGTKQ